MSNAENTCKTCKFIGGRYWGEDCNPIHFCKKSDERRADNFRSCGDAAQDFMNEFRKFYDAGPDYRACAYYEQMEPLEAEKLAVLREVKDAGERAYFEFFSRSNSIAEKLEGKFLQQERYNADVPERRGLKAYRLTKIGEAALSASV